MSIYDAEYDEKYSQMFDRTSKKEITPILENQFYREIEPDNRVKVFCKAFTISAFGFGLIGLIIYYNKWAFRN